MSQPIRLVIADDHEIFRDGFRVLLRKRPEVEVAGEAANGRELLDLVQRTNPDVVVTDIKMPGMDGIEAAKSLQKTKPALGIIALSMFEDESQVVQMLEAGARGYLNKNVSKTELMEAIHTVHGGGTHYCATTSFRLARMIGQSSFQSYQKRKTEFNERELEIIRMICEEKTTKEIAEALCLGARTVDHHREDILRKMEARNVAGLVVYAIKHQLFKMN